VPSSRSEGDSHQLDGVSIGALFIILYHIPYFSRGILNNLVEEFLKFVTDVGFPIAGAVVCGGFVFIILKFILNEITGAVKGLGGMIKSLENRVQTMNNDIVKIDTLVSYAFNKQPNLDRLAANEGKEDARKD
jgi:archaellum biogenesis ATPase FlaH